MFHKDDKELSDIEKLARLIKDIRIAMLTTVDQEGQLHSRPMATQTAEFDGNLWFFTGMSTPKVGEIQKDQHVNVSYAAPDDHRYVSVSGRAEIVRDRKKAEELWNPFYKAWFPKGIDDPDLVLLKVRVERAEYWDSPSSPVVYLVGFLKAIVTGERAEVRENEKIDLRR